MKKEYKKDNTIIVWDNSKCTHSGVCVRGLPNVFQPKERPWIKIDAESEEKIKEQVLKCPSGALSLKS